MTIKICGVKDTFKADMVSIIKAIDCVKTMGNFEINFVVCVLPTIIIISVLIYYFIVVKKIYF